MNNTNKPLTIYVKNKGKQTLTPDTFVASGGEGSIYKVGQTAFKIYENPNKMIPEKKIEELKALSHINNVLRPMDIILDKKQNPIGFTMSYVSDVEFLTRMFNKNYRIQNKITPKIIIDIIKKMQLILQEIHKCGILVVDFNEMNSVTNKKYDDIFFIDVDSYQTKSYKATALMETVRDRTISNNKFTEGSDWFSFAIVSFQLYMTYHPYSKGKYKTYTHKDWSIRMDENISVFHPDVILADIWKDFSIIPPVHLEWYKEVFHKGYRNSPPLPEEIALFAPMPTISIINSKTFTVKKLFNYSKPIKSYFFINGFSLVITEEGIYRGMDLITKNTDHLHSLLLTKDNEIVKVNKKDDMVYFINKEEVLGKSCASDIMYYKNKIYTIWNGKLTEHKIERIGNKDIHMMKIVSNIFRPATQLFSGVAVQNILGKCWITIPYTEGTCYDGPVKELNGERIITAKYENHILMVITEKLGTYNRFILCFDNSFSSYVCHKRANEDDLTTNFTCLANGLCIHMSNDDYIEVFKDLSKIKKIKDPPITTNMLLTNDSTSVLFINNSDLYQISMK